MLSEAAGRTGGAGLPGTCQSTTPRPLGLNGMCPAVAASTPGRAAIRSVSVWKNAADAGPEPGPRSGSCTAAVHRRSAEKPSGTSRRLIKLLVNAAAVNTSATAIAIWPATRTFRQRLDPVATRLSPVLSDRSSGHRSSPAAGTMPANTVLPTAATTANPYVHGPIADGRI